MCALFSVCVVHMSCMWWSEDNLQEELLSVLHMGSQDGTQIIRLSTQENLSSTVYIEIKGDEPKCISLISNHFFF